MAEIIIPLVILSYVALIMLIIGIIQVKSKTPVGFYSGVEPPKAENLTDVKAWNKKHGLMWIIYGIVILSSIIPVLIMRESIWCIVPMIVGMLLPIGIMIWYHHRLCKIYIKK